MANENTSLGAVRSDYRNALATTARKVALAGMVGAATIAGTFASEPQPALAGGGEVSEVSSTAPDWDFSKWYNLTLANRRFIADSLRGKDFVIKIDTPDLRLHTKVITPDLVWLDTNMDMTKHPYSLGEGSEGHTVPLQMTAKQYHELQQRLEQINEKTAGSQNSGVFPGDLKAVEGMEFSITGDSFVFDPVKGKSPVLKVDEIRYPENPPTPNQNFLWYYSLAGDAQRKWADSLLGKNVALIVDTPYLRLHEKLVTTDHVQLDLVLSDTPPNPTSDGHPVEMRVPIELYEKMKKEFDKVPYGTTEKTSLPGDLIVPAKTVLSSKVDNLPRGDNPTQKYSQFDLIDYSSLP